MHDNHDIFQMELIHLKFPQQFPDIVFKGQKNGFSGDVEYFAIGIPRLVCSLAGYSFFLVT
jgi:hypothetical protein